MGRSRFLSILLISAVISLSFSPGLGRRVKMMRNFDKGLSSLPLLQGYTRMIRREMVEMEMDYKDPGANTNPRSGRLFDPPTPTPTPPPPPPPPPGHY